MLLAIDAGNTNVVFAFFKGKTLAASWRVETDPWATPEAIKRAIMAGLKKAGAAPAGLSGAIIASVVPSLTPSLKAAFKAVSGEPLLVVGDKGVELGIKNKLLKPSQAGADRLLNALAGREYYGAPLIIVDFGTATTLDVVGKDGSYLGGVICPGPNLSAKALNLYTAKLPRVVVKPPKKALGRDTRQAMQSGLFFGHLGAIEALIARLREELGGPVKAVATGGLAALFVKKSKVLRVQRPDLTLQGLRLVFERNRK
jgi:type III pantothenate kinase